VIPQHATNEYGGPYTASLTLWCDVCGEPVTADAPGWIKTNPDAINERRDLLSAWYKRHPGPRRHLTAEARAGYPRPVEWITVHIACDPWPEFTSHGFSARRGRTERDLIYLSAAVAAKSWSAHTNWSLFLRNVLGQNADLSTSNDGPTA
jgi:hypothetical protein